MHLKNISLAVINFISERQLMRLFFECKHQMGDKPGQKVRLIVYGNRLEVVPVRDIKGARGFLKGMSSDIERDEEDR